MKRIIPYGRIRLAAYENESNFRIPNEGSRSIGGKTLDSGKIERW